MQLQVAPLESWVDAPISVSLSGLQPGERVEVSASFTMEAADFRSRGVFVADDQGTVDLDRDAPLSGTFALADPRALFWSALTDSPMWMTEAPAEPGPLKPLRARIVADAERSGSTTAEVLRHLVAPEVSRREVRDAGLVATYYAPPGAGPHPTVIAFGGSDGGLRAESRWAHLASYGFATLVVGYFGVPPLPADVVEVPLEYFQSAVDWLDQEPTADTSRLGATGISWGGQLVVGFACFEPRVRAVVALSGSPVCWCGFSSEDVTFAETASWTYGGQALPFLRPDPEAMATAVASIMAGEPVDVPSTVYGAALDDERAAERAMFPLERINGPVLWVSGERDEIWTATRLADIGVKRLAEVGHPHPVEHLVFPEAGHFVWTPERPAYAFDTSTIAATALASREAWQRVIGFLRAHLTG